MDRGLEKNLVQGCTDIQQVKTLFGFSDKETEMLKKNTGNVSDVCKSVLFFFDRHR